jgi:uncharacterized protein YoxC
MSDRNYKTAGSAAVAAITERRRRRRGAWQLLGLVLIAYGVIGLVLLSMVGTALAAPITQLDSITNTVEAQRTAALDSLERASDTIDRTADAVNGMDQSLADAKAATDRSSDIAVGVATSMTQLADSMTLTIFGVQPLIGLQPGFANSASQLNLLADDLKTISTALESNRGDALTVAQSLGELSGSLSRLTTAVRAGPHLELASASVDTVRVGVLALLAWLAVLALGAIGAGAGCWWYAGQP